MTITNVSGVVQTNYPLQFGRPFMDNEIPDFPQVLLNGTPILTQADVKNRYADGSVKFAVISLVIPTLPTAPLTLNFQDQATGNNTPLTQAEMLDPSYGFDAQMSLTGAGVTLTADARQMLAAGNYKLWTSGPVAQTIVLADDSAAAAYDLGFDGNHPFRPRFYATFWPATHQVKIRYVGENGNTRQLEDLSYTLSLRVNAQAQPFYTNPLTHYAMSNWTKTAWFGGMPSAQVNIDYNLPYLEATHYLPNYDTSITISENVIEAEYTACENSPHDLFDAGLWTQAMPTVGERAEIGPYPVWTVLWFYTGDWRMREAALEQADLASAWPANLREGNPTKDLLRTDASGAGTGLGLPVSISSRPTFMSTELTYSYTQPQDAVTIVGPIDNNDPWMFDGAHQPDAFFPQYILTGDPYYLDEMYMWAAFSAAFYNGAANTYSYGRGPTGAEGVINDELRGAGWVLRSRAETAVAAPDSDPERTYFSTLTNDALARWEGGFNITGDAYTGNAVWTWGNQMGDAYSCNGGLVSCQPPVLHNWESNLDPATITENEQAGIFVPGAVSTFTAPWMQYYVLYGIGRAAELGFAAGPLLAYTGPWLVGMINMSGFPMLVANYQLPVEKNGGGFLATWQDVLATLTSNYLTNLLPPYFVANLNSEGREVWATPALSYLYSQSGGAQAWDWWQQNVYSAVPDFNTNPKWAIIPAGPTMQPGYELSVGVTGSGTVANSPSGITCPGTCSANFSSGTQVSLTAIPAGGWTFAGWGGACSGTGSCTVMMGANQSVSATFTQTLLPLTVGVTGSGTITSSPPNFDCGGPAACTTSFAAGTGVALIATPASGWTFAGWSGACSGTGACMLQMSAAESVTASFVRQSVTLSIAKIGHGRVVSRPAGIACGRTCRVNFMAGMTVVLNHAAPTGWHFVRWGGACSGRSRSCWVTLEATKDVTALFEK